MHPLRRAIEKYWAPAPWMLEAAIILEIVLGDYVEPAIIAALLVLNAATAGSAVLIDQVKVPVLRRRNIG